MFFFRHPKPVIDGRAVAVQVVQQKASTQAPNLLVAAEALPRTAELPASGDTQAPVKDQ